MEGKYIYTNLAFLPNDKENYFNFFKNYYMTFLHFCKSLLNILINILQVYKLFLIKFIKIKLSKALFDVEHFAVNSFIKIKNLNFVV